GAGRRSDSFTLKIFRALDAGLLERDDRRFRPIEWNEERHDSVVGILGIESDERIHVGEAEIVGARGNLADRIPGAVAAVDLHGQTLLGEMTVIFGKGEQAVNSL